MSPPEDRGQPKLGVRFYRPSGGGDPVRAELKALGTGAETHALALIKRRQRRECFPREDAAVAGDLRELRTTYDSIEYRVFYSLEGPHGEIVLVLVVAIKKAQRIPVAIAKAQKRLDDWRRRGGT
jgi:phage-related protein